MISYQVASINLKIKAWIVVIKPLSCLSLRFSSLSKLIPYWVNYSPIFLLRNVYLIRLENKAENKTESLGFCIARRHKSTRMIALKNCEVSENMQDFSHYESQ